MEEPIETMDGSNLELNRLFPKCRPRQSPSVSPSFTQALTSQSLSSPGNKGSSINGIDFIQNTLIVKGSPHPADLNLNCIQDSSDDNDNYAPSQLSADDFASNDKYCSLDSMSFGGCPEDKRDMSSNTFERMSVDSGTASSTPASHSGSSNSESIRLDRVEDADVDVSVVSAYEDCEERYARPVLDSSYEDSPRSFPNQVQNHQRKEHFCLRDSRIEAAGGREVFSQSKSRPARRRHDDCRWLHQHSVVLQRDIDVRNCNSSSSSHSSSSSTSLRAYQNQEDVPSPGSHQHVDAGPSLVPGEVPLVYEARLSGSSEVVFDDIGEWISRGLTVKGIQRNVPSDFSPAQEYQVNHLDTLEGESNQESPTRVTKIGNVPIAEYEGSPRRYGQRSVSQGHSPRSGGSKCGCPRPGFPKRITVAESPSGNGLAIKDSHATKISQSTKDCQREESEGKGQYAYHVQWPEGVLADEEHSDRDSILSVPPTVSISTLTSAYSSSVTSNGYLKQVPELSTAVSTTEPSYFEKPSEAYDYSVEVSETKKVLEDFFRETAACKPAEFYDLEYSLKRQHGNSYVGQRLAAECDGDRESKESTKVLDVDKCFTSQGDNQKPDDEEETCLCEVSMPTESSQKREKGSYSECEVRDSSSQHLYELPGETSTNFILKDSVVPPPPQSTTSATNSTSNINSCGLPPVTSNNCSPDSSLLEQEAIASLPEDLIYDRNDVILLFKDNSTDELEEEPLQDASRDYDEMDTTERQLEGCDDSVLDEYVAAMSHGVSSTDSKTALLSREDAQSHGISQQVAVCLNFTLSSDTSSCDSADVESEFSNEPEGSIHSSSRGMCPAMPVLEDGLSSGEQSEVEMCEVSQHDDCLIPSTQPDSIVTESSSISSVTLPRGRSLDDQLYEKLQEAPPPPAPHPHRGNGILVHSGHAMENGHANPLLCSQPHTLSSNHIVGHLHTPQYTNAASSAPQHISSHAEVVPHMVPGHPATHDLSHSPACVSSATPAPQSRESVEAAIADIKQAIRRSKNVPLKSSHSLERSPGDDKGPVWVPRNLGCRRDFPHPLPQPPGAQMALVGPTPLPRSSPLQQCSVNQKDPPTSPAHEARPLDRRHNQDEEDGDTDQETDRLLGQQRMDDNYFDHKEKDGNSRKKGRSKEVLIEGVLFRARYLGSTQLVSEGQPTKTTRMMQAEEAVSRIKAPDGESQPSTEVDLFISTEKIMVLNTDLKEIMMDHALRSISYIADIGDLVVLMARRRLLPTDEGSTSGIQKTPKMICHVFESDEAQFIAQSIGQAFQVAYLEFLKANGIEDHSFVKEMDYQEVLNSQEIFGDELQMFAKKELQKEVVVPKLKGDILGVVVVESGWGSMVPTVVIANLSPTGAAAKCGMLNIGDQIIAINGVSLVGLPLSTCQNYIKNTKYNTAVKLTVVPCPPVVEVKIRRPDTKYQLGFSVQNGVICSLLRGGIAERGGVRVGHRIIDINSQSVVAVPHEKIVNLLATSVGEIRMKTMPTSIFRLLTGQESPQYI